MAMRQRLAGHPVGEVVLQLAHRLRAAAVVESSLVLSAQGFLALFPLLILVFAISPSRFSNGLVDTLRARAGLGGSSAHDVENLLSHRDALRGGITVVGFVLVFGSATAFTRALQRVYERTWDLPRLGLRGVWRGVAWLGGFVVYLALIGLAIQLTRSLALGGVWGAIGAIGMWWWSPFLLLGGRVRWRALLPTAVLTATGQLALSLGSAVVMPRLIRNNETQYGAIGVVFAIESWMLVVAGVVVVGASLGAMLARAPWPIGRWIRGTDDHEGWQRGRGVRSVNPAESGTDP